MNFHLRENKTLRRLSDRAYGRLGPNLYLIFGIMAVLFVFSGLVVGLLGRGWIAAWLFVMLGLILGFFPCLRFLMGIPSEADEEDDPGSGDFYDKDPYYPGGGDGSGADPYFAGKGEANRGRGYEGEKGEGYRGRSYEAENANETVDPQELDAVIASLQQQLEAETRRREEARRRARAEEEARTESIRRSRERLEEEQRRRAKERERIRRNEETSAKWNHSTGKRVYKAENVGGPRPQAEGGGFFAGISSSADLKKRYKELMKIHHPDNGGNADDMNRVMKEYKELELFFRSYEKHNPGT